MVTPAELKMVSFFKRLNGSVESPLGNLTLNSNKLNLIPVQRTFFPPFFILTHFVSERG